MKLTIDEIEAIRDAIQDVRMNGQRNPDKDSRKYDKGIQTLTTLRQDLGKVTVKIS